MLKILLVLPFYGGSLPIGRYCHAALQELGCLVEVFESPEFYGSFAALQSLGVGGPQADYLENSMLQVVSQAICAKAEAFRPDLVLAMAQAPLSRQALKRLKKEGIPTAMWFVEDFRLFTYWRAFAPYYDLFAVIQKEPFLSELHAIGVENTLYLPLAALPSLHAPRVLSSVEKASYGADVSFLGAGYPNRLAAFRSFAEGLGKNVKFKIWGTEWEGEPRLAPYVQREGARIAPEEAVLVYNASTVNLNLHSSIQTEHLVSNGDFVNPRTFELACAGVFQLVDRRSLLDELFEADTLASFSSLEEMTRLAQHYLANPEERQAIVAKGRQRVLDAHCYTHRMQALLDFASTVLPGFGHRKEPESFSAIPAASREALSNLMQSSGFALDASFADVIAAVRQKKGTLSDVETALLFMDEWRKQYS